MNWIQGMQRAIDYVEAHITEEIDVEEVARQAYSSPFHFQRVFGILCGFSLGDYIRMRRLSLAGEELAGGSARVIDVALKYGYDTPESFFRAFTRFHGIAPSEAKHSGQVKIFTPLLFRWCARESGWASPSLPTPPPTSPPCGRNTARTAPWPGSSPACPRSR